MLVKLLHSWLKYDAGVLRWIESPHPCKPFLKGREAGTIRAWVGLDRAGYRVIKLFGDCIYTHRAVYLMHTGKSPEVVDHINGDTFDNRIENLRSANKAMNARNAGRKNQNPIFRGVRKLPSGRFQVRVGQETIGTYSSVVEAMQHRISAESKRGYHPNHGRQL